jgi:hypothetical protein
VILTRITSFTAENFMTLNNDYHQLRDSREYGILDSGQLGMTSTERARGGLKVGGPAQTSKTNRITRIFEDGLYDEFTTHRYSNYCEV